MNTSHTISEDEDGERPETIGRYRILRVLGRGAAGIVYLAEDPEIGRTVAIKTIHGELIQGPRAQRYRDRFVQEIRTIGQLGHPHIIVVFDCGEHEGVPYFAMEYMERGPLSAHLLPGTRLHRDHVKRIGTQLLDALAAIHARRIVHRDIKPSNLFMTENGDVKLGDFGVAKVPDSNLTRVESRIGTPAYMSPEQDGDARDVDERSDLFAVGIVLFELLTGHRPFDDTNSAVRALLRPPASSPSRFDRSLSSRVDALFAQALEVDPDKRFQTAVEFREALEAALREPPANRRWIAMGIAAAVALVVGLTLALLDFRRAQLPPPTPTAASTQTAHSPTPASSSTEAQQRSAEDPPPSPAPTEVTAGASSPRPLSTGLPADPEVRSSSTDATRPPSRTRHSMKPTAPQRSGRCTDALQRSSLLQTPEDIRFIRENCGPE